MEFGKASNLDSVNFALPPGPAFNAKIWASAERSIHPEVFIGGPVWANKQYVGKNLSFFSQRKRLPELLCPAV